jgi:hypothetical protein
VDEPHYYGPADLLALLKSQRVVRDFSTALVEEPHLWMILEAGRRASSPTRRL